MKTARLVVLLEPDVARRLKRWSRHHCQPVARVVRQSIHEYLNAEAARERMASVRGLSRFTLPMKGLEDPGALTRALHERYRTV